MSEPITPAELAAWREAKRAATPLPWIVLGPTEHAGVCYVHADGLHAHFGNRGKSLEDARLTTIARDNLARLLDAAEENARLRDKETQDFFKLKAADALADAVAALVTMGRLDARSRAGDALLDYRDPPRTERSDALAKSEAEIARLRADVTHAINEAKRREPDYPWSEGTASEAVWALGEGLIGARMAIKDCSKVILRLKGENTRLRAALANSELPCVYCTLPAAEIAKCPAGFPGCGRADDAMGCPELGAKLEADRLRAKLELCAGSIREALEKDDAPCSAESHLEEALAAVAEYLPVTWAYSPEATKERLRLAELARLQAAVREERDTAIAESQRLDDLAARAEEHGAKANYVTMLSVKAESQRAVAARLSEILGEKT